MLTTTTETVAAREQPACKPGAAGRGSTARTRASRWGWVAVAIACVAVWGASAQAAQAAPKLVSDWIGGDLVGAAPPVEGNGGLLSEPSGVAVNVDGSGGAGAGDVYVADSQQNRVQQFTADGEFVRAWGLDVIVNGDPAPANDNGSGFEICDVTAGNSVEDCKAGVGSGAGGGVPGGALALATSSGVAVDQASGEVYVADSGNRRVQRFSATGEFISAWGKDVIAAEASTDTGTGFEVCDTSAPFPSDAEDCKQGESGTLGGELSSARGIAVVPSGPPNAGNVIVTDPGTNRRVQEFTADGEFVRLWGRDVIVNTDPAPPNSNGTDFEVCDTGHPVSQNDPADCKAGINAATGEAGFPFAAPWSVAVDTAGAVYTVDVGVSINLVETVRKFSPDTTAAEDEPTLTHEFFASGLGLLEGGGNAGAQRVAVGAAGNVLVSMGGFDAPTGSCTAVPSQCERRVLEFDPAGTQLIDEHMAGSGINWHDGLTANPDTGRIYVASRDLGSDSGLGSETEANRVYIVDDVVPPLAEVDPVEPAVDIGRFRATLQGTVDATGSRTGYHFEYKLSSDPDAPASWTAVPASDVDVGSGAVPVGVSRTALGLSPATSYDVRLVAAKPFTTLTHTSGEASFTTLDAPPGIRGVDAAAKARSAKLSGRIVPNGSLTEYWFEYGPAPCSASPCTTVPVPDGPEDPGDPDADAGDIGDGQLAVKVAQSVAGLEPLTTYHYRLVAENVAAGETASADRMFTTAEPPPPPGRGYELVTPFDAGGADTYGAGVGMATALGLRDPWLFNAAPGGERVSFTSLPELPGSNPPRMEFRTVHRAQRRADLGRWTQAQMSPPGSRIASAIGGGAAEDLSIFHFAAADRPVGTLHDDDPGPERDVYLREPDGGWTWASRNSLPVQDAAYGISTLGVSPDGRTSAFRSPVPLEPEADGVGNALYTQHPDGTRAEVVSIVDDETGPDPGTVVIADGRALVSDDGQRILFRTGGGGTPLRWWIRLRDEDRSVEVTAPAAGGARSGAGTDVLAMARDASVVIFETAQPLTGDDLDGEVDLFRFHLDGGELERLSAASPLAPSDGQGEGSDCGTPSYGVAGCTVSGVVASEDGSTAYFLSPEQLDEGAQRGEPNLYVNRGGETRLVAVLKGGTDDGSDAGPTESPSDEPEPPSLRSSVVYERPARVTSDGGTLVFRSHAQLTSFDNGEVAEIYVFDADTGAVRCASCALVGDPPSENPDNRPAALETQVYNLFSLLQLGHARGRNLTADGSRVYFDTEERLVARDRNGARDVYEYDVAADRVSLVSTGQHSEDSFYYDNSSDGRDVFFITRERLVARDLNGGAMRIYDAREGGGFPQPSTPDPCAGGECRGAPTPGPAFGSPATGPSGGAGNVQPAERRRVALRRPGRRGLRRAARSGRLIVAVGSNRAGRVRVRALARIGRRIRPVARQRVRMRSAGRARVVLRLSRRARRVLVRRGRLRLRVVASAPGAKPRRVGLVLRRAGR